MPTSRGNSSNDLSNFHMWLDAFRWIAALQVVFFHVSHRFFIKLFALPHEQRSNFHYIYSVGSSFGVAAVMSFFVLSGFLVGGTSVGKYIENGKFDYIDYFLSRIVRLWTVLIPSFAVTYTLNMLALTYFNASSNHIYSIDGSYDKISQGLPTAICNAVFLQSVACNEYGTNGALWSLFHEFWYYMVFPLFMIAIWGRSTFWVKSLAAVAGAVILLTLATLQFASPNIALYFLIWLLGVVAARRENTFFRLSTRMSICVFLSCLILWRLIIPTGDELRPWWSMQSFADFGLSISFANLLIALRTSTQLVAPPGGKLNGKLAAFSFSLYCIHTPIVNCYGAFLLWLTGRGWQMVPQGPVDYLYAISAVAISVLIAWGFSYLAERHTYQIRAALRSFRRQFAARYETAK